MHKDLKIQVLNLIGPTIEALGFTCRDVQWQAHDRVLCVYVERAEGVNLDQCAEVSRALNDVPDLDALIEGPYTLEVSSPGLEKPLRTKEHFADELGQQIHVSLYEKFGGIKTAKGTLEKISDQNQETMLEVKT